MKVQGFGFWGEGLGLTFLGEGLGFGDEGLGLRVWGCWLTA